MPHPRRFHNVHLLQLSYAREVVEQLASAGVEPGAARPEDFVHTAVRLQRLEPREAAALSALAESAGVAMATGRNGALLGGSVSALRGLVHRLAAAEAAEERPLARLGQELSSCLAARRGVMRWGDRELDFRQGPLVMGVLNCTPDSFFPGSRLADSEEALERAAGMVEAGADILDVGGESTRPGSEPAEEAEERRRVVPVIEGIRRRWDVLVSVDTRKAGVAQAALEAGADMINDVSGLRDDPALAGLAAARGVPVVVMHMRGTPKTMQKAPHYEDTVREVLEELAEMAEGALVAGVAPEMIILDPGIGFGKRLEDNLRLIRHGQALRSLGFPLLVGLSRKSFIGAVLEVPVEERLLGSIVAGAAAAINGADILRVHDVAETVQMVRMLKSLGLVPS